MLKWIAASVVSLASLTFAQAQMEVAKPAEVPNSDMARQDNAQGAGGMQMLESDPGVYGFALERLDGEMEGIAAYRGKVMLMVNTASKCGNTKQYAALQTLFEKYKDKNFVVLGFPANNFGNQEPGSDEQIAEFCTANYGVTFPMFSKVSVKGDDQAPLYAYLTSHGKPTGDIKWNFEKFLIGKDGYIVARFAPKTLPDAPEVIAAIEKALAE